MNQPNQLPGDGNLSLSYEELVHQNHGPVVKSTIRGAKQGLDIPKMQNIAMDPYTMAETFKGIPDPTLDELVEMGDRLASFRTAAREYLANLEDALTFGAIDFKTLHAYPEVDPKDFVGLLPATGVQVEHHVEARDGGEYIFDQVKYFPNVNLRHMDSESMTITHTLNSIWGTGIYTLHELLIMDRGPGGSFWQVKFTSPLVDAKSEYAKNPPEWLRPILLPHMSAGKHLDTHSPSLQADWQPEETRRGLQSIVDHLEQATNQLSAV